MMLKEGETVGIKKNVQFREVTNIFITSFGGQFYAEPDKTTDKTTEKTTEKGLTPTEKKILKLVDSNPAITQKEMAIRLGLTEDGVYYHITRLKKRGLLKGVGGRRTGRWEVAK